METPEGVTIELRPAGLVPRFCAFAIDGLIRLAVYMALAEPLVLLGKFGLGLFFLLLFLIEWFYPVVFELTLSGATPGKRVMGITVVEENGLPVTFGASVTRNLLRFVDFLPVAYAAGILSLIFTRDFQRLGDLAAGTLVVYRPSKSVAIKLPDVEPLAIERPLDADTQSALIGLAVRERYLTPERAAELVQLAVVITQAARAPLSSTDESGQRKRVLGQARWLLGDRDGPSGPEGSAHSGASAAALQAAATR